MDIRYILVIVIALIGLVLVSYYGDSGQKEEDTKAHTPVKKEQKEVHTEAPSAPKKEPVKVVPMPEKAMTDPEPKPQPPEESPQEEVQYCKDLSARMLTCSHYTCDMPHPHVPGFTVTHTIHGKLDNDLCAHSQTSPNNELVLCNYSQGLRFLVARSMQRPQPEPFTNDEMAMLSAGFESECLVFNTITGQVISE